MTTPDHLTPIEPASAVETLCKRLAPEIPAHVYGVVAELSAFLETCMPHDGRRLANALRHVLKRPDLAAEVEALLPPAPRPPDLAGVLQMQPSGRWAVCMPGREPIERDVRRCWGARKARHCMRIIWRRNGRWDLP